MLGIRCSEHSLYNGARPPADPCPACSMVHAFSLSTHYVDNLERIQPIKMVRDLSAYTTQALLAEISKRLG